MEQDTRAVIERLNDSLSMSGLSLRRFAHALGTRWTLIGGLMTQLHAIRNRSRIARTSQAQIVRGF